MIYTDKIKEAVYFASKAHKDQKRKILDYPYISHPMAVMFLVSKFSEEEDVLVASVLHDVVEDTNTNLEEIERIFGKKVRDLIDVLTEDDSLLDKEEKETKQLERFKNASKDALLIKLADIIHNFTDILLVFKNHFKEEYLDVFGDDIENKVKKAEQRIEVIETAWQDNPLLPEVKSRFKDYKKGLVELGLWKM